MWEWDCRNENLAKGRKSRNTHIVIMHFWLLESRLSLGHWTIVCILLTWSQTSRWISYPSLHLPPQWFRVLKIWFLSKHFLTQLSTLLPYMYISNSSMVASFSSSTYFIFRYGIFRWRKWMHLWPRWRWMHQPWKRQRHRILPRKGRRRRRRRRSLN